MFLLYKEPEAFRTFNSKELGGEEFLARRKFQAKNFVRDQKLELVGVNWFLGVGDSFVEPITLEME